jgi:PKD repeat protein
MPLITRWSTRRTRVAAVAVSLLLSLAACRDRALPPDPGDGGQRTEPGNQRPVAVAGGPYTTADGVVRFDGSGSSDPDGDLLRYRWEFGDGDADTGVAPRHHYLGDGTYTARLIVVDPGGDSSASSYATVSVRRTGTAAVIAGAGRVARCGNPLVQATARLLDSVPGLVFAAGDNALPNGTPADYANCYHPTWGRHLGRSFAVMGNHEYDLGNANPAFDYFGWRAGPRGVGYYSFDLGDWHVVVLNDREGYVPFDSSSAQVRWLRADLAASTKRCTIALWHMGLFFSSNTAGYTVNPTRRALWEALYQAGADVVINANQHHYERLAPMRPDGTRDDAGGIRSFNVGTGGESLSEPTVAIHPNSEVRNATHGVLTLTLRAGRYDAAFVPVAGETFRDAVTGFCH